MDLVMATSSSSSFYSATPIQGKYEAFISFRGSDTRDNFLSHLHAALCRKKIETFIDNDLSRGDNVSDALLKTIAESKISVIIFSKNYGDSRWCLDELLQIMKCKRENGQIVIPVFYKVDPSHIRKQSGPFGQAFAQLEGHPKVQQWRDALTEAGHLSGWDSKGTEAKLIEEIVGDIWSKLYYASSSDCDGLVGIRSRIQHIESMLNACSEDVRIIGIWGMGGIGKSTLAGAFFNQMFPQFEGHCFLANVREQSHQKHGANILRQKLLAEILKDDNVNVATPHLGLSFIRSRLHHKKVLVVLDDVDDPHHLEFLAGGHHWFGQGSVIIMTSRDKQVLQNGVDCIYEIPGLDDNEAISLFSRYAFKEKHLPEGYEWELSSKAITYAKGNPLALKILGPHLRGRSKQEQESALRKLERTPNIAVQQVLLISYEGLDHEEKRLFLNIACLFKGAFVDEAKRFHDACGFSTDIGIRALVDKSLVTVANYGRVWMHDLLQEMGRQIVREESIEEPGKRSRLWDHGDISRVLTENTGTEAVKGILLDTCETTRRLNINPAAFESMPNLEFLKINAYSWFLESSVVCLPHGLKCLSNKLRYLWWEQYPLTYLPSNFHPENLVELRMPESHLERLWDGRQNLVHLKEIDLSHSKKLIEIPDLSLAINLRTLYFTCCPKLKKFPELPLEIRKVILWEAGIEEVPSTIYNLKSLIMLDLYCCKRLKKFPEVPLQIQDLCLRNTEIEEVPSTICNLKSLIVLDLSGCKRLKKFPELPLQIRHLSLSRTGIEEVPSTICNLKSLIWLDLVWCERLKKFPELPLQIESLSLSRTGIEEVPSTICNLKSLTMLDLEGCKRLKKLPELPLQTQYLRLYETGIEEVPSTICNLKSLIELDLQRCERLKKLPELPLEIQRLRLSRSGIEEVSSTICNLKSLTLLELRSCKRLPSLPQLPKNVQHIDAANCISLEMVASPSFIGTSANSYWFSIDFSNCFKLNQIARKNIVADAESRLLHQRATYLDICSQETSTGRIWFAGNDVPDWFHYKTSGSSLIVKLPSHWCNDALCCLAFSSVIEFMDCPRFYENNICGYKWRIRNNRGNSYNDSFDYYFDWNMEDGTVSNQVLLSYNEQIASYWRKIPKEADDVDEISIEFYAYTCGNAKHYYKIKECGVDLLYAHDIEDRCNRSMVQPYSPCGDLTKFSLEQFCIDDDIKELVIQGAEDYGGYNDNSCNEELAPILRRRMKVKRKINTFKFTKFLGVRRKSSQKVWRSYCKIKEKMDIDIP